AEPAEAGGRRAAGPSVLALLGLPLRDRDVAPLQVGAAVVVERDEGVLHVVLIIAIGVVVRSRMRPAALPARKPGHDHALGELEQEAELERLRQVAVEDVPLVLDDDALVALAQPGDQLALLLHLVLAPEDAEVLVHRLRKLVADLPRTLALR